MEQAKIKVITVRIAPDDARRAEIAAWKAQLAL